jgi:hypothetical protein
VATDERPGGQRLVVEHEPLDDEFPERPRRPDTELGGLGAVEVRRSTLNSSAIFFGLNQNAAINRAAPVSDVVEDDLMAVRANDIGVHDRRAHGG